MLVIIEAVCLAIREAHSIVMEGHIKSEFKLALYEQLERLVHREVSIFSIFY